MIAIAAFLLIGTPPISASSALSGFYQAHEMEMGAALELSADGHFRYQLDYGAVSESGQGNWTNNGSAVILRSSPMPVLPAFELVRDDPAPIGEIYLTLEPSNYDFGTPLYAVATLNRSDLTRVSTAEDGRVEAPANGTITAIAPIIPGLGPTARKFELSGLRGHRLLLRFHAHDLGQARFERQALPIDDGDLLLDRYDTTIRFQRAKP